MTPLDQCLIEQRACADYRGPDAKGAMAGLMDWMAEECILRTKDNEYQQFLASKRLLAQPVGFECRQLNPMLFDFQSDITRWACRRGRAAIFAECGMGKTFMQLEWARCVGDVLIFAPLAVGRQTQREGSKLGIEVTVCETQADVRHGINITNYEKIEHFDPDMFRGVVCDESSILKGDGPMRKAITDFSANIHYRLACTATPAPNDYMELGNHAEYLGIMNKAEMLSMFFVHDGGETSKWRLKGHAEEAFWKWVASWAVMIRKPSDLGYDDGAFILPPIEYHQHSVEAEWQSDTLFPVEALTLDDRRKARRGSLDERVKLCADLVNNSDESWLVWCDLNDESKALANSIRGAVEVTGSDSAKHKEDSATDFAEGRINTLVSKPAIFGFGMNFQNCHNIAFVGLSDSWEQVYQATRRCWRFGQSEQVHVHFITGELEGAVVRNIQRKEQQASEMAEGMVKHMKDINTAEVHGAARTVEDYKRSVHKSDRFTMHLGDSAEVLSDIPSDSVDYMIYSPPFASLYTYSNSERDLGNCKDHAEFFDHYTRFITPQLYRILKPGRLLSFHCMNLPSSKERDGVIGLKDFRGDLIRIHQAGGMIYASEVCIWKDPVTAMQRTKAIGLLYKQLRKDSALSRQGIPDYLVTMRKPGVNPNPITKTHESFRVGEWQEYASPVWMDINPSDTLQKASVREDEDERHICPLQLEVVERALRLWTNPDDVVLSPFAGIGSEGYVALKMGRSFIGVELKESYWKQAVKNCENAAMVGEQGPLFAEALA